MQVEVMAAIIENFTFIHSVIKTTPVLLSRDKTVLISWWQLRLRGVLTCGGSCSWTRWEPTGAGLNLAAEPSKPAKQVETKWVIPHTTTGLFGSIHHRIKWCFIIWVCSPVTVTLSVLCMLCVHVMHVRGVLLSNQYIHVWAWQLATAQTNQYEV